MSETEIASEKTERPAVKKTKKEAIKQEKVEKIKSSLKKINKANTETNGDDEEEDVIHVVLPKKKVTIPTPEPKTEPKTEPPKSEPPKTEPITIPVARPCPQVNFIKTKPDRYDFIFG